MGLGCSHGMKRFMASFRYRCRCGVTVELRWRFGLSSLEGGGRGGIEVVEAALDRSQLGEACVQFSFHDPFLGKGE